MPHALVICLSLHLPAYKSDTKATAPLGAIAIKPLAVLWCL